MKKLFMLAVTALFAANAMALENVPETGFTHQVFAGFDVSGMTNSGYKSKVGAYFGYKLEYMLPNAYGTYINAGVDWIQKGCKDKFDTNTDGYKDKVILQAHYMEVPIHVGYRYNINEKFGVYYDMGPYFAVGVTGKSKVKYGDDSIDDTHTMTFGKTDPFGTGKIRTMQRFDCGFGFRVGAEYNNQYSINFAWDWGFTDAYTDKYRKAYKNKNRVALGKLKNHDFCLSFGYRF